MNLFVADPEWGWWIILYFFLGGLAAGCYFSATLIEIFGHEDDEPLARIGYRVAFPLVVICGLLLIVDLERPERFWHMMLQSERVADVQDQGWPLGGWGTFFDAIMLKWWSPMSIGAQALGLFGLCSFISLIGTFWPKRWHAKIPGSFLVGLLFKFIGCTVGFFVASYTGALLTATNQSVWMASNWIAPLFLTSAASTGIALLLLLERRVPEASKERLERADLWALGLELFVFLIFLASLGQALPVALMTVQGIGMVLGTLIIGLLVPLWLHLEFAEHGPARARFKPVVASWCALAGGLILRHGIVRVPASLLAKPPLVSADADIPLGQSWEGIILLGVTVALAILIPLTLARRWKLKAAPTLLAGAVSLLVIAGVALYEFNPVGLRRALTPLPLISISPEDNRPRGGGPGASDINRPAQPISRSKIPMSKSP